MTIKQDYKAIAQGKREQRDSLIPSEWRIESPSKAVQNVLDLPAKCGLLSSKELTITSDHDAVDLLENIRTKKYSAEEVTRAFCKRAAIAQQLTNCLTEIFFDEAIERAKILDREQAANPNLPLRPLHGLPISIKDSFRVPGVDSTTGLICWANEPDTLYSSLPRLLLDLGAVLYCKTNVPQTMMTADSDNNVFGRTLNPNNLTLTAGGSSGGEGALIALRGSLLGVGTDIAGSIRIPSICNGIYGFRPSASIVPYGGQRSPAPAGIPGISPVAGPMVTSLRSCTYFMKTIMEAQPWRYDPACLHRPWTGQLAAQKLRIGVVSRDGLFTPWPPVRRNIAESARKLGDAGVEIVNLSLPDVGEAVDTIMRMFSLDGSKFIQNLLASGGEPEVRSVRNINLAGIPSANLEDYFKLNAARSRIQQVYHNLWLDNRLDAIVLPPAPTTATPLDQWGPISYTALWNLLDYPAVIIPTGKVQPVDEADSVEHAIHGERDRRNYQLYTGPTEFANAPLAVQVVGMKQEDEELTQVAAVIDKILNST
ncbi:hypothetical protein M409DRAFT_61989 [Zasmidium cellare ATCC 36951]|uniref:amidase n=1 Tax=Zasmidium cellare ATCC 36951 TaxID=1080233 RepID=A0A6A6D6B7_ZASCE|nr:uncharacterized protein M409DRAFT_61989 [Zasmidium cellare ATCC 36951]KAF2173699.1 hypothetical protein M409DRAFT_61989 [Zasmidium cellare ATCC 36951]